MLKSISQLAAVCSRAGFRNMKDVSTSVFKGTLQPTVATKLPLCHQVSKLHTLSYRKGLITNNISSLLTTPGFLMHNIAPTASPNLLMPTLATSLQARSVVKWSLQKGKRKTVKAVLKRFKRLDWGGRGMWIRARQGASKKMWKKSPRQRLRAKTHVFCNATQSQMLDKMVCRYWKRTRHYPDDPFKPYLHRDNFRATESRPREFF